MPQRLGDTEHRHVLAVGDAGKAVAQAVQRDWRQPLLCNKLCDALAEDIRLIGLSRLVYGNITFRVICRILLPPLLPFAVQTVQHMMLANGVVGKALFPQLPVILLHTHGRQLLHMHLAKRWNHVGVQDILIPVARCFRAGGVMISRIQ